MIRLTWEETVLIILFSAVMGGIHNGWALAACGTFITFIIVAAYRAGAGEKGK